jgi:hypothetical protein
MPQHLEFNPNGIAPQSPGLLSLRGYPGSVSKKEFATLKAVAPKNDFSGNSHENFAPIRAIRFPKINS